LNDTKESHNNSGFKNGFFATFFFRLKLMEKRFEAELKFGSDYQVIF
jgi:hypothetical protein